MKIEPWRIAVVGGIWTGLYQTVKLILDYRTTQKELDLKEKELEIKYNASN